MKSITRGPFFAVLPLEETLAMGCHDHSVLQTLMSYASHRSLDHGFLYSKFLPPSFLDTSVEWLRHLEV